MATLQEVNNSVKSAHHRINELSAEVKDMRELTNAVAVTARNVEVLQGDVTEIKQDVKNITSRPGKLWDKLIGGIIGAVATGIAAAILAFILK
ncbi:MAG: hypothetical protein II802_03945 [Clostridia bacterium]|nr:hypothetical protein [Clostridia bacterium]